MVTTNSLICGMVKALSVLLRTSAFAPHAKLDSQRVYKRFLEFWVHLKMFDIGIIRNLTIYRLLYIQFQNLKNSELFST